MLSVSLVGPARIGKSSILRYLEARLTARDEEMARKRVAAMCDALLANLIIERYEFSLAEEAS